MDTTPPSAVAPKSDLPPTATDSTSPPSPPPPTINPPTATPQGSDRPWLDVNAYPHIIDTVFMFVDGPTLARFRCVSKHFHDLCHPRFPRHLRWDGDSWNVAVNVKDKQSNWQCAWQELPPREEEGPGLLLFTRQAGSWRPSQVSLPCSPVPVERSRSDHKGTQNRVDRGHSLQAEIENFLGHTLVVDFSAHLALPDDDNIYSSEFGWFWFCFNTPESNKRGQQTRKALPYVRLFAATTSADYLPVIECIDTLVLCRMSHPNPQPDHEMPIAMLEIQRLVVHLGSPLAVLAVEGGVEYLTEGGEIVLFVDSTVELGRTNGLAPRLVAEMIVPKVFMWWTDLEEQGSRLPAIFPSTTRGEENRNGARVVVGAEAAVSDAELQHLRSLFNVSDIPATTLADFMRTAGYKLHGREHFDRQCKFYTREEYEAHIGTKCYKIENGDEFFE